MPKMRLLKFGISALLLQPCLTFGQSWEVGAAGGYGTYRKVDVTGQSASGKTGFDPGFAVGALLGNDFYQFVSGEIRYTYRQNDLVVTSGSSKASMRGNSSALHYDVLFHAARKDSRVRPFAAAGGGIKYYRGTGEQAAFQPLSNLILLTHTSEVKPLISFGGGVKLAVSRRALARIDVRDYATPFPEKLLTPNRTQAHGWMHDFVFLIGISTTF